MSRIASLVFFGSGACALANEVLWPRAFAVAFGGTHRAEAVVLAAFFLGLALGNGLGSRLARAPTASALWRRYSLCEIATGATALLPALLSSRIGEALPSSPDESPLPYFLSALLLLALPVVAAGATWPLMVAIEQARGAAVGGLYAINVSGALVGATVATFALAETLGTRGALLLSAISSASLGVVALLLSKLPLALVVEGGEGVAPGRRSATERPSAAPGAPWTFGIASGALVLAFEVACSRLYALRLVSTVYSFGTVLAVQLLGLLLGGLVARSLASRARDALPALALAGALAAALAPTTVSLMPSRDAGSWAGDMLSSALLVLAGAGPAALLLGAIFPLASGALSERDGPASLGRLAAANALAGLAGALVAGFLSVPLLGVGGTFAAIAALAAALGAASAIASGAPRRKATVVAALALVAVAALAALRFQPERLHAGDRIVSRVDGPSASVAVIEDEHGTRRLVANDRYTLGDTASRVVERREALLPFVLRPRPARTVVIGLATGITADAACEAALVSSGTVVVAELLPEVVRLAPAFEPFLGRAPRARVVVADGRRYLARDEALADLVVSDIFAPWQPGTAYLYTLEHFSSVRAHLGPGGAFALWLPLFQLSPSSLVLILRTFETAFPGSRLYAGSLEGERPIVLAFSRGADPGAGVERRRLALAGVLADDPVLSIDGGEAALDLGPLEVVVPAVASAFSVRDDRVQRDDRPWVEFEAARAYARGLALTGARFEKLVLAADLACGPGESAGWHAVRASWASAGSARGHLKSALSGNGSVRGREAALPLVHAVARTRSAALSAAGDPLAGGELAALAALASSGNERTKAALAATAAFRKAGALARAEAVLREIAPGDALLPPDEAALALEGAQLALARRDADRALAWLFRVPEGDAFVPGLVLVAVAQDSRSERALARKALVEAYRRDAKTAERELQRLGVLAWGRALVGER